MMNYKNYILFINRLEEVTEIPLPAADNRKFMVNICGCNIDIEVFNGVWRMLASDDVNIMTDDKLTDSATIETNKTIHIIPKNGERFAVLVQETNMENASFSKYSVADKQSITIGRENDNDIVIHSEYAGAHHCTITKDNNGYILTDNSKNGTFVNGKRIHGSIELNIFDTIYIVGNKIFFLGNVIAVCNTDEAVSAKLPAADLKGMVNKQIFEDTSYFSRAPRRIEPLDSETVEIDDPPAKQKMREQPLIFIIGPSVTMHIPILVSVIVNIVSNSGSGRSGIMYLGMALSVILSALIGTGWALAHQMYNKKQLAADEKERIEAYSAYIENNKNLLEEKHTKNKSILEKSFLSTSEFQNMLNDHPELLWNRNVYQSDFLAIRLGKGKVRLPAEIAVSKQRFSMTNDELAEYPHHLHDKYELMDNCISTIRIIDHKIIGLAGKSDKLHLIANNLICQLAALHCYTDVKIGILGSGYDADTYMWTKWLPHSFINGMETRLIGFDDNSRKKVIHELSAILYRRKENAEENKNILLPHFVIFCTSPEIIMNSALAGYLSSPLYLGITFVLVYGEINKLPNECKAIIECSDGFSGFYMLDEEIKDENNIEFDFTGSDTAEKFARTISGYYVNELRAGTIPKSADYFEMIGIGRLEQWDLIKRYKINRSYEGIRAFVGYSCGETPVFLDIHDKQDGPHGLVAGTTGSGKSEFLQTFILSIAMNYSPDDVAFILIDYKGGGMANYFEKLPHIAGMLTNLSDEISGELDTSLTRRMCSSLRSEIKRRQSIFKEYKINHIDAYAKLFRSGKAAVPMPHLIIISDEFAELRKEQPEFIKELVSVSRVGRSLGIHLILSTQKPSGVVDDEIWSNSRFKVCLRVQDKQDSNEMLKRSDAAYITDAGRAFLQIGNDEFFEEFQSGYSGGEFIPKDEIISASDNEAAIIDINGMIVLNHEQQNDRDTVNRANNAGQKITELEAAVEYIWQCSAKNGIHHTASIWLPPLERVITLDKVETNAVDGKIIASYGLVDDFEQQRQYPCSIDLMSCSNLKICGMSGSGKTTLLQTILCSVVQKYSLEKFAFYIIDFSSRTFKMFKGLPHCGGVVYEEEDEAIDRTIKLIFDIISERKKLFEKENVGSFKEYAKMNDLPLIAFIIDNFAAFNELYSGYEEMLIKLVHDGVRYGIQTVLTLNNTSELKYKMRSYVTDSIVLRMTEKGEYNELIGKNPDYVPANISGRGLIFSGGNVLEYQAALPAEGDNEYERSENMKIMFSEITDRYKDSLKARRIPVIPANTVYSAMLDENYRNDLLIGYNFETTEEYSLPLSSFYCYCVSDNDFKGTSLFMDNLSEYTKKFNITLKIIKLNEHIEFEIPDSCDVFNDISGIHSLTEYLLAEFSERNKAIPKYNEEKPDMPRDRFMAENFGRIFVIIDDMVKFCDIIYNDPDGRACADNFNMIFNMGKNHGIHFFGGYNSGTKTYLEASKTFKSGNTGIHFGGEANNQNALEIDMPLVLKLKKFPSNIGFGVEDKKYITVYVPERK